MILSSLGRMLSRRRIKGLVGKEFFGGLDYVIRMIFVRLIIKYILILNVILNKIFFFCVIFYSNLKFSIEGIFWNSVDLNVVCVCVYCILRIYGNVCYNIFFC